MSMMPDVETAPRVRPRETEEISRGFTLPLVLGPLRGSWWQPASGGKIARVLLGTYEPEQTKIFQEHIRPGQTVLDIGAAAGYYTLVSAGLVGKTGRVFAFEPDPTNLKYLRAHVQQNRLSQVVVLPLAIADRHGVARFGGGSGTGTGRLCDDGAHEVPLTRLDDLLEEVRFAPNHLKIDVEGAELAVLHGGEQMIRQHRPTIFLSTHEWITPGIHRSCCELLTSWDYDLAPIHGADVATATELLCIPNTHHV